MCRSMSNAYGWSLAKKIKGLYLWSRRYNGELIWNLTFKDTPPMTSEGYTKDELREQIL
jgi:hypothetical protein